MYQFANGKLIGDLSVLVAETLATWKALETIIQEKLSNVIIETDCLIAIQAINGETKPPSQLFDTVTIFDNRLKM